MTRTHARAAGRPAVEDQDVTERTGSDDGQSSRGPAPWSSRLPSGGSVIALLVVVAVIAPVVPRTALVEAGTYLAPLALFLGLLSTTDRLAADR